MIALFVALVTFFHLARWWWFEAPVFIEVLTPTRLAPFISLSKLVPQALGSYYASRCAHHYGRRTPIRRAWMLMSAWLGCWFVGQLTLGWYVIVAHQAPPTPSLTDLFFVAGSLLVFGALLTFVSVYRASGFAVGTGRQHAAVLIVSCGLVSIIGYSILVPIARDGQPLVERTVSLVYPLQDLLLLATITILFRVTLGFRGGRVWPVWAAILAGILCATGGDVLFAYSAIRNLTHVAPLADLSFTLGYALCAYGVKLQHELVAGD